MCKSKEQTLANQFILKGLKTPLDPKRYWAPLEDSVLMLLDDFFNKKIDTKTTGKIGKILYEFQYFTYELYCVDPELFKVLDYLVVLYNPSVLRTKAKNSVKIRQAVKLLKNYYESKKSRVDFLRVYFSKQ